MRRRDFIGLIGGAVVAWPRAARTQQSLPLIGFLHQGSLPPPALTAIFRKGLVEAGVVAGKTSGSNSVRRMGNTIDYPHLRRTWSAVG